MTDTKLKQSMTILGKAQPSDFTKLFDQQKQASAGAPKVGADEVEDVKLERTDDTIDLHDAYIRLLEEDAAIIRDLVLVKMKLKTHCGDAAGIDGVCTYVREDIRSFGEEAFKQDHPDVHETYTIKGSSMRRATVRRTRDY